jgi:hypothetical protein
MRRRPGSAIASYHVCRRSLPSRGSTSSVRWTKVAVRYQRPAYRERMASSSPSAVAGAAVGGCAP